MHNQRIEIWPSFGAVDCRNRCIAIGPGSQAVSGTVVLRGYSPALTRSDVGPGNLANVGRSCVVLDHAGAALIDRNVLHDCNGASPGLYIAGVLSATSVRAHISNNVIFGNLGGDALGERRLDLEQPMLRRHRQLRTRERRQWRWPGVAAHGASSGSPLISASAARCAAW